MTTFCIRGGAEANKECVEAERRATAAARWSSVSLRYVKLVTQVDRQLLTLVNIFALKIKKTKH